MNTQHTHTHQKQTNKQTLERRGRISKEDRAVAMEVTEKTRECGVPETKSRRDTSEKVY